jgi:parallel beta-helix repeat protein
MSRQYYRLTGISGIFRSNFFWLTLYLFSIIIFPLPQYAVATADDSVRKLKDETKQTSLQIYVNPLSGNDERGRGSLQSPFKTITQALMLAQPKTTIVLAAGTYSKETGEEFPLILKSNVVIQGNPNTIGKDIIIQGSGIYTSPTAAAQNVTIVATKNAGKLIGVTVINPSSRGHGLWIESASPEIISNMFAGSGTSGVSVNGNSSPLIANNYFYQNRGNGLLVYGTSRPQIKNNIFDRTGFGVSAVQNTGITLLNNRFYHNRIGIILEGDAKAILRNNLIENSTEDGLVTIARASVDLGTIDRPGNNAFKNNLGSDIRNLTKKETIAAYGNQLNGKKQGAIDLNAKVSPVDFTAPITSNTVNERKLSNISTLTNTTTIDRTQSREITFSASDEVTENVSTTNNPERPTNNTSTPTLPPPPTISSNSTTNNRNTTDRQNLGDVLSNLGNDRTSTTRQITGEYYRVIVATQTDSQKQNVRSLYPDAFNTNYQGRSMLQVGVFSSRDKAEQTLQSLQDLGFDGLIVQK